jgi:hypothetical protein
MTNSTAQRQVIPLSEAFFNDGYWYVLSSTSLGKSKLSAAQITERLQSRSREHIEPLLAKGVCLPLFFPGDCALDHAIVVIGDLTEQEEAEWIGRMRAKLAIPCGEFMVMGGGLEEDFEVSLNHFTAPNPHFVFFEKFKVDPGVYLIEVYAFISSMTANFAFEKWSENEESLEDWWKRTRYDQPYPPWLSSYLEEEYVDSEDHDLVEYIIRLSLLTEEVALPEMDEEHQWCGEFELRRPDPCPLGIFRTDLIG